MSGSVSLPIAIFSAIRRVDSVDTDFERTLRRHSLWTAGRKPLFRRCR